MSVAHVDLDAFKYSCASVGEKRSIKVIHKKTGWEGEFDSRTAFWGHHKKKAGGYLAEVNAKKVEKGQEPATPEDFIIEDIQVVTEPIQNILHTVKQAVKSAVDLSGASRAAYYIGRGESFRVERSTLLEYKGNRKTMQKPLLLDEVVEFMTKKFSAEVVRGYEVDDIVVMNSFGKKDHFIIGEDKDFYGSGSKFFNFEKSEEGIIDTNCFGKLWLEEWLDSKGRKQSKVRGYGRLFKLWQCCSQDDSDNYKANCMSDVNWGEISAYKALVDCKDDKESWRSAADIFKNLYPELKIVKGWRGDDIEIDWLYVFQECFDMCHLHRKKGDFVNVKDVLNKMEIC